MHEQDLFALIREFEEDAEDNWVDVDTLRHILANRGATPEELERVEHELLAEDAIERDPRGRVRTNRKRF